ncbi:murein DD-endopeptidase MepM/ murein hydrolase activator NlpD [Elusimicrobium simillimum]|uniref:M23 family metallopeptidase n=1 Tax=Elusimicrobium simillimum TaxID=3143438 RepID=UPI003C6F1C51
MKNKIKNAAKTCYHHYLKVSEILFYFLIVCIIVCIGSIYFIVKDKEAKKAAILPLPVTSVQEDSMQKTPLYTRLEQTGMSRVQIHAITNKLDTVMNTRKIRPQDSFMLVTGEEGEFKMLVVTRDLSRYYVAAVENDLVAGILDIEIKTRTQNAAGSIESSLFASMQSEGMMVPIIIAFTDVFSWNIDFNTETRKGDTYALVWEEDFTANGMIVDQRILAAKYEGASAGKNYAFDFEDDFYDESGKVTKRMFLKSPISFKGVRITSRFSNGRMHPILRIKRPHHGIDYAAPVGTPIEAIADGTVKFSGWKGGFGNYIEVAHANNYTTTYGHLKSMNVKVGEKVKQGKVIAYLGSTGLSTGPHLDFRIREGKKYIDFLKMKNRNSALKEIPKEKMKDFEAQRDKYLKILNSIQESD